VISRKSKASVSRFTRRDAIRLVGAAVLLIAALTAILTIDDLPQGYNLNVGDIATQQIRSPKALTYVSDILTQEAKAAASKAVAPQYDYGAETAAIQARNQLDALATELKPADDAFQQVDDPILRAARLDYVLPGLSDSARKILKRSRRSAGPSSPPTRRASSVRRSAASSAIPPLKPSGAPSATGSPRS